MIIRFVLGLFVLTLIILIPIIILRLISGKKGGIERIEFGLSILGCFLLGLVVPIIATSISTYGLTFGYADGKPICVTGIGIFFFFGYLINIIGVPIAGIVLFPRRITIKKL